MNDLFVILFGGGVIIAFGVMITILLVGWNYHKSAKEDELNGD